MSEDIGHEFRLLQVVHGALLAAIVVYGLVAHVVVVERNVKQDSTVLVSLLLVAVASLGAAHVFRRRSQHALGLSEQSARHPVTQAPSERPKPNAEALVRSYIVPWALVEAVAAQGLVAAILTGNSHHYYAFGVPAGLILWLWRPRKHSVGSMSGRGGFSTSSTERFK